MWICPNCERKLKNANQWHCCEKIEIDSLFEGKNPQLLDIFDRLFLDLEQWADVSISATKNCIVFVRNQTFLVVRPMKKALDFKFYLPDFSEEFPVCKCVEYNGKYETHVRLSELDELTTAVYDLIKTSYKML
jgi:hypothetical protein